MKQPRAADIVRPDSTNDGCNSCSRMPRRPLCWRSSCARSAALRERRTPWPQPLLRGGRAVGRGRAAAGAPLRQRWVME
uniref:Uncharacterized protein n=1 Tax=Oryza nivara TaxID=4536 RepID=A0A0E0FQS5_ORYNI